MKRIDADIKAGQFHRAYLLYGEEAYLRLQYKKKLLSALVPGDDQVNLSRFAGKDAGEAAIAAQAETLPFFAAHRVILIEDSGLFKKKSELLADAIGSFPQSTILLFDETEVDKRNRLFKWVSKEGIASEFARQSEALLTRWILSRINKAGKKLTKQTMEAFLLRTGDDMSRIETELSKLLAYTDGRDVITREDVEAVCTQTLTNRIFDMVQAVAERDAKRARRLYEDLLAQKEPPMRILYLLGREFSQLYQISALANAGYDRGVMQSKLGLPPFVVRKYLPIAARYGEEALEEIVGDFVKTETDVKTGRLQDALAVELMIVKYSA